MKSIEGLSGFSAFFYRLAEIGFSEIPLFIDRVVAFLNHSLDYYLSRFLILDYNVDTALGAFLVSIWNSIQQDNVINAIGKGFGSILKILGFDTSLPLWQFMLHNIGLILAFSIAMKFFKSVF